MKGDARRGKVVLPPLKPQEIKITPHVTCFSCESVPNHEIHVCNREKHLKVLFLPVGAPCVTREICPTKRRPG